jgi:hypothetical protein
MKLSLDLNKILIILGGIGVLAPDLTSASAWLASNHVGWLTHVAHGLGLLAAFCAAAPLVVPRARRFLAGFGLATPPGAQAPWNPKTDAVVPIAQMRAPDPDSVNTPVKPLPSTEEITKPFAPKKPPLDPTG